MSSETRHFEDPIKTGIAIAEKYVTGKTEG
jgi:hypothetical protein